MRLEVGISSRMNVFWRRCRAERDSRIVEIFCEQVESLFDDGIGRVEFLRTDIGVHGVLDLLVTTLVQGAEIEPNFGNVRVETNGA